MKNEWVEIKDQNTIKGLLLDMLSYFDEVCRKHNLRYTLAYGTLIGALRHKGFIPWDDDIDVIMPQEDYQRMLVLEEFNNPNQSRYLLHHALVEKKNDEKYAYPFAKIMDSMTKSVYLHTRDKGGLFIDVFPVTGLPKDELERRKHIQTCKRLKRCLDIGNTRDLFPEYSGIQFVKDVRRNMYWLLQKHYRDRLIKTAFCNDFHASDEVAVSAFVVYGEMLPTAWFDEYIDVEFEGRRFSAIKECEHCLTKIYGDWTKLPPKEKQIPHHEYTTYILE